jgi:hypothetical protein
MLLLAQICALAAAPAVQAASCGPAFKDQDSGGTSHFVVYDGLLYRNKPDLSAYGIRRVSIIDRGIWPPTDPSQTPDPVRVAKVAGTFPDNDTPVVLDFELFPLTGSDATVRESIAKLRGILAAFRQQKPARRYGFYGALPIADYWRAVKLNRSNAKFRSWQADNDRLKSLEADVDVLFPSLYTFYDYPDGWRKYAIAQICEARRISKRPVIVFLWPEFHDSNNRVRERFLAPDFWQMELDLARRYADGIVLWGGYDLQNNHPRDWDETAPWWQVTKLFMRRVPGTRPAPVEHAGDE